MRKSFNFILCLFLNQKEINIISVRFRDELLDKTIITRELQKNNRTTWFKKQKKHKKHVTTNNNKFYFIFWVIKK